MILRTFSRIAAHFQKDVGISSVKLSKIAISHVSEQIYVFFNGMYWSYINFHTNSTLLCISPKRRISHYDLKEGPKL